MVGAFKAYLPRMAGHPLSAGLTRATVLGKGYRWISAVESLTADTAGALKTVMRQLQAGEAAVRSREANQSRLIHIRTCAGRERILAVR